MIGALQSLNYYASTADKLGAPVPLNPSATPDPQVHRWACTDINGTSLWVTSHRFDRMDAVRAIANEPALARSPQFDCQAR